MKNFSPIVALRVRGWFACIAVEAVRADGSTERVHICDSAEDALAKLAARAARRGMIVADNGMSAILPQE